MLLELLEEKEYNETENLMKIQKIVQNIAYFNNRFNSALKESSPVLEQIEITYDESIKNIEKTNEELRQAAIYKNETNFLKYPLIAGAVGTIVPGIGNVIGLSLGYLVAKMQEKGIKNIESWKYNKKK